MKSCFTNFILAVLFLTSIFTTSFAQINWTRQNGGNPVLSPGTLGSWEDWGVYMPFVLKHGDTLKMWYSGAKSEDVHQIGYAISLDGINWQRKTLKPVLSVGASGSWDAEMVINPRIILVDKTYHMWYGGTDNLPNPIFRIGYATSPDGINWTKYPENPVLSLGDLEEWDSATGAGHSYFFDGDTFHIWYAGTDDLSDRRYRIGYATSPDGINWTKFSGNPVFSGSGTWDSVKVATPCVIVDNSGYKMWYHGYDGSNWRIGYATSADRINWVALDSSVLDIGDPGTWDDRFAGNPYVFLDDTTYHMWYTGSDYGTPNYGEHIGYATASIDDPNSININNNENNSQRFVLFQNYPNPFNPTTNIKFSIPKSEFITLKIYNLLGQEVATLASYKLTPGNYNYSWDASDFASGVYYYQLVAGDFREVRKMLMVK